MSAVSESSTANKNSEDSSTEKTAENNKSDPQPGPSNSSNNFLIDDPKPGPSTTAADFDLEVFDSGSSCSLEDCWSRKDPAPSGSSSSSRAPLTSTTSSKGLRSKSQRTKKHLVSSENSTSESSENESYEDILVMSSSPLDPPMESACPSETEEAISEDEMDKMDGEDEEEDEEQDEHCQCPKSLIALPPLRLSEVQNSTNQNCWKCAGPSTSTASVTLCSAHSGSGSSSGGSSGTSGGVSESTENIDEIVQDHDNFGTDENEEDSLDSSSISMYLMEHNPDKNPESSFSKNGSGVKKMASLGNPSKIGGFKRKSGDEIMDSHDDLDHLSIEALIAKRKRETFADQEQEVCLATTSGSSSSSSTSASTSTCSPGSGPPGASGYPDFSNAKMEIDHKMIAEPVSSVPPEPPRDLEPWLDRFSSWSHAQRLCAIDLLVSRCHPTQVRHMMSVIEPQFQRDFISLLPKELALYVLSFLHPRDLLRAAQTCRYWRILAEDNLLWREKCREAGLEDSLTDMMTIRRSRRFPMPSCSSHNPNQQAFASSPWKGGFMRQHNIEINWRVRGIRPPKVLKGHDDHVITCLQFSNNRIVSGSDDNTLKVWNATTGKCLRTLAGHTGGVWSSQMQGNIIVSGSTDRSLKVWNADSGNCLHTLEGHSSTVRCMHLHGKRVVSGSRDATLRMWDIETGQCLHVLVGHVAAVRCVQYDGRLVVSGAYDYMVRVWNPETEECLHTLSGHTNRVYSLQFDGIHVVSGSLDTSIRVWDVETGACKHALMGHQSLTSGMELRNNILVSGNADATAKVWDITTGQCLQTLSGLNKHKTAVTCLQFNSKFVITSSDDGTVKLWDVKTGEFIRDLVALESKNNGGVVWRIRANATKLVCAVGSRNGTEETKLLVLDFDVQDSK